jgi:lysyl-tRNA synthetase class 2
MRAAGRFVKENDGGVTFSGRLGIAEPIAGMRVFPGMDLDDSTAIRGIRYDGARQRLVVRFIDGDEYAYVGVRGEVHRSFAEAPSKGRFFAHEIRGRYPYNKLT